MQVQELFERVAQTRPSYGPVDLARLCLVLLNSEHDLVSLEEPRVLEKACQDATLRLHFCTDQHAAMTQELEELAASDPKKFEPEKIWTLIRAIKVQSQILQMYVGGAVLDV